MENKYETFVEDMLGNLLPSGEGDEEGNGLLDSFKVIASIVALPDEEFKLLSEIFLAELEKNTTTPELQLVMADYVKKENLEAEDLLKLRATIMKEVEENLSELPQDRISFIKRIVGICLNTISESIGINKRVVAIPFQKIYKDTKTPAYAHLTDAGADIYAAEEIILGPGEQAIVPTGLKVAIPFGYEIQVRPKSGIASKTKLRIANTPGTIDSAYRGEIGVIIENLENPIKDLAYDFDENGKPVITSILHGQTYIIEKGQKIAQLVVAELSIGSFYEVEDIGEYPSDRGEGGFGSTGLK